MAGINIYSGEEIKALDKENVLGSVEQLPDQIEQVWSELELIKIPTGYGEIKSIVVSGMGGSALGARVIQALYKKSLPCPMEVVNHYELPGYVGENSLVVLSSYSGTTEETLASAEDAKKRKAKIAVITAGGELLKLAEDNDYPYYKIDPKHNPSKQPRMAIGSSIMGQLALFQKLNLISVEDEEVNGVVSYLREAAKKLSPSVIEENVAKKMARMAVGKLVFIVSAEHLAGAGHVMNNQINENAKNMTAELVIPELNHHYMEGLPNPESIKDKAVFLLFSSDLYHLHVQKRFPLTHDVIVKNGLEAVTYKMKANNKFLQVWELIQLGAYMNFYLAMLNGVNPAPIPWVDYFKKQLKK